MFYNFLPDKCLTLKPNVNKNNCMRIESLGSDIIGEAKKIIIGQRKKIETSEERKSDKLIEKLVSDNDELKSTMKSLLSTLEKQNGKIELLLKKNNL